MFKKLAAIADILDSNGHNEIANTATQLLKQAQLFESLRSLFDPESAGLDRDTAYWKRLQRGWSRGKMDRNLGLVLAIMAERTKINKKIDELSEPIKGFQEQVATFYDKLRSHNSEVRADGLKNELRDLQNGLKSMLKLVASKELKNALRLRERLQDQQLKAAEKIKGLDDDTKTNLLSILSGDKSANNENEIALNKQNIDIPTAIRMAKWLRSVGLKQKGLHDGRKSKNINIFRSFISEYHANPTAIIEFFNSNPQAMEKGFDLFGKDFSNMLFWAENAIKKDQEAADKEAVKIVPDTNKEENKSTEQNNIISEPASPSAPKSTKQKTIAPTAIISSPESHGLSPEEEELRRREVAPALEKMRKERDKEIVRKLKEHKERTKEIQQQVESQPTTAPVVTTTAQRAMREITRFGRMKRIEKLVNAADIYDLYPEGRETFDNNKDYASSETALEMTDGLQEDERYHASTIGEHYHNLSMRLRRVKHRLMTIVEFDDADLGEIKKLKNEISNLSGQMEIMRDEYGYDDK